MLRAILAAALLLLALAGCGGSASPNSTGASSSGSSTSSSGPLPGAGKPPVTLGTKNFTEQYILGELYGQALRAQGYRVKITRDIGSSEVVDRALTQGRIDGYPEYTGTILTAVAHRPEPPRSARDAYAKAAAFERSRGRALLEASSAEDTDVLAVKPAFARRMKLRSLGDLRRLGAKVTLGAAAEFRTRYSADLRRLYGVSAMRFSPLEIGTQYKSLDRRRVQVAAVFTTDGQLSEGGYTLLEDPKDLFGFQNVTFVLRRSVLDRQGPAFARTLNAVSAKLSTQALRVLNASVVLDQQSPAAVARQFLRANGLV
jgi:osmoprotectant transport system substrate-binding protein